MNTPSQVADRVLKQITPRDIDQNVRRALDTTIRTGAQQASSLKTEWEQQQFYLLATRAFDAQQRITEHERSETAATG